jgi:hypothetical protein
VAGSVAEPGGSQPRNNKKQRLRIFVYILLKTTARSDRDRSGGLFLFRDNVWPRYAAKAAKTASGIPTTLG